MRWEYRKDDPMCVASARKPHVEVPRVPIGDEKAILAPLSCFFQSSLTITTTLTSSISNEITLLAQSPEQRTAIMAELLAGKSLREVADNFSTTQSTTVSRRPQNAGNNTTTSDHNREKGALGSSCLCRLY
ncbi:unnamed protein product [Fusarium venenatum]|uniref:Uncharacterized protein n=1 Tax=Fusarium venenatum TaxID=56646 RepID=A0A2L2U460_9HYPO|nr:uncharacterized protein FVRRES_11047 [Fusarium venenatum]CEI70970.1 unnamed protein product [Fusarium venenatum]